MTTENQNLETTQSTTSTTPKTKKLLLLGAMLLLPILIFMVVSQMNPETPPTVQEKIDPQVVDLINQSLEAYNLKDYQKSIDLCNQVIAINPKFIVAYTNLCASYNMLEEWDKAIEAGEKAISIDPTFPLAIGNLAVAKEGKMKKEALQE